MKRVLFSLIALLLMAQATQAQNTSSVVSGTVTDSSTGDPLIGVSIAVKGTTRGVNSDINGQYTIKVFPGENTLVFSYVGYETKEISIENRSKIDVTMQGMALSIPEVVVVGYGAQKKSDLTGAVSVVNVESLSKHEVPTLDQALQGQVAGVDVTANSGTPGGGVMVRIRGIGTLNNSEPLFVVDGMMVEDIDFLSPGDVKSVQVLKDASSTAIYGSRGSNGVVIITTKGGSNREKAKVTYDTYYGVQNFWRSINVLDAPSWATLKNEAMVAAGLEAPIADPSALSTTDWFDEISHKNAPILNANLSVAGGSKKSNYYLSANYFKQEGILYKTGFDRIALRANSSYKVKPWLKFGENLTLVKNKYQSLAEQDEWTSAIITAIAADPASPVRYDDGEFARGIYNDTWNPAAIQAYTNNDDVVYRTIGNVFADVEFIKNLTFTTKYSLEYSFGETSDFNPVYYVSPVQQNNTSNLSINNSNRLIGQWSNTLNYKRSFGEHSFSVLVGAESYSYEYKYNGLSVNDIPTDDIDIRFADNAAGNNAATVWGSRQQVKQLSYLSRLNYNFREKYLFTANFRADASSKFSKKNRWGYFPSFSFGWRVTQEDFMKNFERVSNLKLRLGWGQIGNQGSVPPYQDVTTASPGANYLWGGQLAPGISFPGSGNDEIKWETSTTLNFGIDYGLFNGKLSGAIDYFIKNTTGMLLQVPIPAQSGIQFPPTQNAGSMKNTGLELSARYTNKDHDLHYSVGVVFSKIKNEVTDLGAEDAFIDGAPFFNSYYITRTTVGKPIAQFYGFKTDGLFQNQAEIDAQTAQTDVAPGDVRYVDADNDGELDLFYLGSPLPDFTYGLNGSLDYKGIDFSFQLQGVQGNKIFNGTSQYKLSSTATWNLGRDMMNRWTGEGTQNDARYPRMNAADVNNSRMSDRFIEDGSYLRIKSVQLGYNIKLGNLLKVEKLRVYLNAQNLFTFTKYTGLDPEIGMRDYDPLDVGIDRGYYPVARTYSVGLNLTF